MSAVRNWQLLIDWSGSGSYSAALEDATSYVNRSDIVATWGRPVDTVSQNTPTSTLSFELRNRDRAWDRWFSPENASSPIAGKILPGRRTQLTKQARGNQLLYSENFATSTGGWAAVSGGTATRVGSPSEEGNGSLSYVPPGAVATVGITSTTYVDMTTQPAGQLLASVRIQASAAAGSVSAMIDWYDVSNVLISSTTAANVALASGVWTTVQNLATVPVTAVRARLRVQIGGTPPNTTTFYVDQASLTGAPADAGKIYNLWGGLLDDFSVDPQSAARTFSGESLDAWGRSSAEPLSTPVYQSIRTGDAIGIVLDEAGWTGPRFIDAGVTIIPWWWEQGTDPVEAVEKIVRSEGPPAIAYIEGGTFVFRDRHHRIRAAASNTSQGLFTQIEPAGSGPGYDFKVEKNSFQYDHGLKSIINSVTFSVDQRREQDVTEIWTSDEPIALNTGESVTLFAEPSDPVVGALTPVIGTDVLVTYGTFTAAVDRDSGQRFAITLTCTATGYISRVALRGNPITVARTVQVSSSDPGSISRYNGTFSWPDDAPWANVYDAQAIADRIVTVYSDNRPRISFNIFNYNDRYTSEMLSIRIGDRITVRNDALGVNRDFHVEQLTHTVSRLQVHRLTVSAIAVEPTQPANVFTFNVAGRGFNDGSFGAAAIDSPTTMFIFDQAGQGFDQGLWAT